MCGEGPYTILMTHSPERIALNTMVLNAWDMYQQSEGERRAQAGHSPMLVFDIGRP